jgi:hypothetical protein
VVPVLIRRVIAVVTGVVSSIGQLFVLSGFGNKVAALSLVRLIAISISAAGDAPLTIRSAKADVSPR